MHQCFGAYPFFIILPPIFTYFNVFDVFLVNRLKLEFSDTAFFLPAGAWGLFTVGTTADIIRFPPPSYLTLYLPSSSCVFSLGLSLQLDWLISIIPFSSLLVKKVIYSFAILLLVLERNSMYYST